MTDFEELRVGAIAEGIDRFVVGVIVPCDGKILILQRPADDFMPGIYELPSGKVEPGETLSDAIARELLEETGLHVGSVVSHVGDFDYVSGSLKRTRQLNFEVRVREVREVIHPDHVAAAWVKEADLGRYPITDESRRVMQRYFETLT